MNIIKKLINSFKPKLKNSLDLYLKQEVMLKEGQLFEYYKDNILVFREYIFDDTTKYIFINNVDQIEDDVVQHFKKLKYKIL